ncbi:MAG: LysM peptidoglycan-binding domain-containing protein [Planctomycetota bacterium]|nr:MAG: LysM peptidoglycan-binding domain-containing protein [Planctomycetota bacterium]
MGLDKAQIKDLDTGTILTVCFNPKEYTFTKTAPWAEHNIHGLDAPKYEWTSGAAMRLNVELLFDAYELEGEKRDVRQWTDQLEVFQLVNPDLHRPPILLFWWGDKLQFKCVLRNMSLRFVMFEKDGTPVRAIAKCEFVEYSTPEEQLQAKPRHSPDHTKRRVVKEGDTLSWIAGKEYGNPAEWRIIAEANGIDDPLHLTVGRELLIPPLY